MQVLRPGRIDKHVEVPLPDVANKLAILSYATDAMTLNADVSLEEIAGHPRLLGASGATVVGVCRDAAFAALREFGTDTDRAKGSDSSSDQEAAVGGGRGDALAISVASRHFTAALSRCAVGLS